MEKEQVTEAMNKWPEVGRKERNRCQGRDFKIRVINNDDTNVVSYICISAVQFPNCFHVH